MLCGREWSHASPDEEWGFLLKAWLRKVWVTPGLRHRPDPEIEELKVTCSYVTLHDHQALIWLSQFMRQPKKEEMQQAEVQKTYSIYSMDWQDILFHKGKKIER